MLKEFQLFFRAIQHHTLLPVPMRNLHRYPSAQALHYLPLVGWWVGAIGALTYWLILDFMPASVALIVSMLITAWITDASQQYNFSRISEAISRKHFPQKAITLRKSAIGGTAMLSTIPLVLLKFWALLHLPILVVPIVLVVGHSFSRWAASIMSYIFDTENFTITVKKFSYIFMASIWGILPILLLGNTLWLWLIVPALIFTWLIGFYLQRQLRFFSEDYLSVAQQLTEVGVYLTIMAFYPYVNTIHQTNLHHLVINV